MQPRSVKIFILSVTLVGVAFIVVYVLMKDKNSNANTNSAVANVSANPNLTQPNPGLLLIVTPSKGPAAGGTEVKLTGENFTGTPKVLFGTVEAKDVKIVSKTEITATSPAGTFTPTPGFSKLATSIPIIMASVVTISK